MKRSVSRYFYQADPPALGKRYFHRTLVVVLLLAGLGGCGWWKGNPVRGGTAERLYQSGYQNYHDGDFERAIEAFQRLQEQYPLSELALKAELGIADSHYSAGDFVEAEMTYLDFVNLHPTNENVPYAMYQVGMCHFRQMNSLDRDQTETRRARDSFEKLISRFPATSFVLMARMKLRECEKRLADHEFYVGYFYFRQKQYKAALDRFQGILENYPDVSMDYKVGFLIDETKRRMETEKKKGGVEEEGQPSGGTSAKG